TARHIKEARSNGRGDAAVSATLRRFDHALQTIIRICMKFEKRKPALVLFSVAVLGWSAAGNEVDLSKLPPASDKKGMTYAKEIQPLLQASCFRCHGQEKPKAGLRLDSLEGVLKGSKDGKVIQPGNSKESQLVLAVSQLDEDSAMPPKFKPRGHGGPGGPG